MPLARKLSLALVLVLVVATAAQAQYSQMSQPSTWSGGGRGFGGGGGYGAMHQPGGFPRYNYNPANLSLVISQTDDVHNQVGDLLDQLRRLQGQQVAISTPFHNVNDDFFERIGVGFGFNINAPAPTVGGNSGVVGLLSDGSVNPNGNIQFRQGSIDSGVPPVGGHDPAADANIGFGLLGSEGAALFNFIGGQGNNRSHVSQVPTVVIPSGGTGSFIDTSQTPFVTGLIPVVGHAPALPYYPVSRATTYYPLHDRINRYRQQQHEVQQRRQRGEAAPADKAAMVAAGVDLKKEDKLALNLIASRGSTAGHGDLSVAEIKRRRKASEATAERAASGEILALIERGRGAEEAGKASVAVIYYRQAASRADGELKQELAEKIKQLQEN